MSIVSFFPTTSETKINPILADNTPEQIQKAASAGMAPSYWSVGDSIPITLNGTVGVYRFDYERWYAFIIGFDHNYGIEGMNTIHFQFGRTSGGADIAFVDDYYENSGSTAGFRMNTSATNSGGWESSYMRKNICLPFFDAMPSDWQNVISSCIKYTDNVGDGTGNVAKNVTATEDKIFLLAYNEVFSDYTIYANTYEADYQEVYDYYANGNHGIKYKHTSTSTLCGWWLRSVYSRGDTTFVESYYTGRADYLDADCSNGFAPAFVVA